MKGGIRLKRALSLFFIVLIKPFLYLFKTIYKYGGKIIIIKLYKIYSLIKKFLKKKALKNRFLDVFGPKYIIHIIIIAITIIISISNVYAYEKRSAVIKFEGVGLISDIIKAGEFDSGEELIEKSINIKKISQKSKKQHYIEEGKNSLIYQPQLSVVEESGVDIIINSDSIAYNINIIKTEKTPEKRTEIEYYTVKGGDTVSSIAKQYNITTNTIIWENSLNKYGFIKPGQKLTILPNIGISYSIKKNDTISKIANRYGVKESEIMDTNKIKNASGLQIGQKLIIPGARKITTRTAVARYTPSKKAPIKTVSNIKSYTKLFWPASCSRVSQYYHWKHHGIDIACKINTPIYAAEDGIIERAGWSTGYGKRVVIRHSNGVKTLYAHLNRINVGVGKAVDRGGVVGLMGSTGWSTGSHIHFEVRSGGSKKNPLSYLR